MFGFSIEKGGKTIKDKKYIAYKDIICRNHMIRKFENDKLYSETDDYIVLLDGIILNRKELIELNNNQDWLGIVINLYKKKGDLFFESFRGSFAGAIYDKKNDKWIIFCDQIGSRFVYYSTIGDYFCCAEVMGYMYEMLKHNNISYHLSEQNSLLLLTYGYMLDDRTLCEEVHKINPGCYITYQSGKLEEHRYYLLDNTPDYKITEDEAVEMVDYYFRQAVKREFEKDVEYGYHKHCVSLSGGLDCRMTSFVAHELGYTNQINLTFSQSEYWDQTIPMKMASDWGHEWLFKSLDDGRWLCDIDEVTSRTGGNVLYYGTAHGNSLIKYLNQDGFGMGHSGQLGDAVIGSFIKSNDVNKPYTLGVKAYSLRNINSLDNLKLSLELNKELGMFYYRAFHGTNNGLQNAYHFNESFSPFYELDMLEKALSIPVKYRQNHNLYKKWVVRKYPQAAKYVWETTGRKITTPVLRIGDKVIPWLNIPSSVMAHIRLAVGIKETPMSKKSMNPIAYYLHNNKDIMDFLYGYFGYTDAIASARLRDIIDEIKINGTAIEKIQAVSLLAAVKLFYC